MKKLFSVLVVLFSFGAFAFAQSDEPGIIPKPKSLQRLKGEFRLSAKTKIVAVDEQSRKTAALLNARGSVYFLCGAYKSYVDAEKAM